MHLAGSSVLLHYSWPDKHEVERKMAFYKTAKDQGDVAHPFTFGGELADLPDWAIL